MLLFRWQRTVGYGLDTFAELSGMVDLRAAGFIRRLLHSEVTRLPTRACSYTPCKEAACSIRVELGDSDSDVMDEAELRPTIVGLQTINSLSLFSESADVLLCLL